MKLFPTAENPAPPGSMVHDITTVDGVHLRVLVARQHGAKGTLFILNGRADYVERYFEFIKDMMARGYAVVAFDWRGQGASQRLVPDRLRGYVRSFADYEKDLAAVVALAQRLDFPEPHFAFAHSTGGQILLRALRHKTTFKRAVITAPLLGFNFGRWPKPVVHLLNFLAAVTFMDSSFLPGFARGPMKRSEFDNNPLTSDRVRWNRDCSTLESYPQLGVGGPTYAWLRAALKSFAELRHWRRGHGPDCPTMIVLAGQERVVNNMECRLFVERVPGFSVLTIASSKHEIIMENNVIRNEFFAAFDTFMEV